MCVFDVYLIRFSLNNGKTENNASILLGKQYLFRILIYHPKEYGKPAVTSFGVNFKLEMCINIYQFNLDNDTSY